MTISSDTLSSDVFTEIRTAIVAAAPKVSYGTPTKTKDASILPSYNDEATTIPQIVIYPMGKDESEFKFGSTVGRQFINITVECYYKTTRGIDQLGDAVEKAVREYDFDGMSLVGLTSDYAFVDPNFGKYHIKSITFTFDRE